MMKMLWQIEFHLNVVWGYYFTLVYRVIKHHHGTMEHRVPPTKIHRNRHIICVRGLYFAFVPEEARVE